jgi:phenylalanyl-tRNA synthetase beta chain
MKASLNWIKEFVDLPTDDVGELEAVLSRLGLEVEGVETVEADFTGVVVAKVLTIRPDPEADKVRLATLDAGGDTIEVVCGAWNFEEGDTVAYAQVGSVLPGGFEIGEKKVRGIMSPGMICSEIEMGLGEEAGGILVLEDGYAEPGTDFASTLPYPDNVFDLSITPNRPDAMSIHGVARDLAAYYDLEAREPEVDFEEEGRTNATVRIEAPDRCHRFTAREVKDVTVGPSPLWMRLRLRDAGQRPISNLVDITNYVMLEVGQPLHAFDLDKITDETIVVRLAEDGEHLTTLDDVDRTMSGDDLLIAGVDEPLGLAGIMGGGDSEVSESTTRVLIEVAHFEPTRVLLSGKRHALRTEAVARFERGVDPDLPPLTSDRAATLVTRLAGGTVVGGFVDEHPTPPPEITIDLPDAEFERLIGIPLPVEQQAAYLRRLGFGVEGTDPMRVSVPTHRVYDVTRPADLVEEIARVHGYDEVPIRLTIGTGGGLGPDESMERTLRSLMVGAGYYEVMDFDWLSGDDLAALGLPEGDPRLDPIRIRNPLNEEQEFMRTTMVPGLLDGLRHSASRNRPDARFFEIGSVYLRGGDPLPDQPKRLGFAATGARPSTPLDPAGTYDASDAVGVVEMLGDALGVDLELEQEAIAGMHPGRAARVTLGGEAIGVVGELDPAVAGRWDLDGRVIVGEIDVASLITDEITPFGVPSQYPPVVFDLAFDLAEAVPAGSLVVAIRASAGGDLERVEVFDVFRGSPLDEGRKSVAVRLTMRSKERTLTDEEIAPVRAAITARVADDLGGVLRGG